MFPPKMWYTIYVLLNSCNKYILLDIKQGVDVLFASNKILKTLGIEIKDLKDDAIYLCSVKNKKGEKIRDELIEITGIEIKTLAEMQGYKKGMIRYNKTLYYDVVEEKEEILVH